MNFFNKKFLYITTLCMIYNIDIPFQQNMLLSSGVIYAIENNSIIDTDLEKDVDTLYSKIKGFLDLINYMILNSGKIKTLEKDKFEKETMSEMKLYRGVTEKKYADDLKNGKFI